MNRKAIAIALIVPLLIFVRHVSEPSPFLIYIVGAINIVAVIYVLFTISQRIYKKGFEKIKSRDIPTQFKDRKRRGSLVALWSIFVVVGIILPCIYLFRLCSSEGNDIVSIIALGLSIIDDEIVDLLSDIIA